MLEAFAVSRLHVEGAASRATASDECLALQVIAAVVCHKDFADDVTTLTTAVLIIAQQSGRHAYPEARYALATAGKCNVECHTMALHAHVSG